MPDKKMPKPKSLGPISMLLLPSPALLLAEGEAALKAKAPRLRAQQRGRVAKGKKGRLQAILRRLWGTLGEICRPRLRSHNRSPFYRATSSRGPYRKGEFGNSLRPLPSQKEKG